MKPVPQASPSHLPVCPLGEGTRDPTASVRLQQAHTDGLEHGVEHTQAQANPNMASRRCGHCNRTGGTSGGVRQVQERTHAVSEGWGSQHSLQPSGPCPCEQCWILTSLAGPLTTRTVLPQEAGGMLARVECRTQRAIRTEQGQ